MVSHKSKEVRRSKIWFTTLRVPKHEAQQKDWEERGGEGWEWKGRGGEKMSKVILPQRQYSHSSCGVRLQGRMGAPRGC